MVSLDERFLAVKEKLKVEEKRVRLGVFPPLVAKKLDTFPLDLLDDIKWVDNAPDRKTFRGDLNVIIEEMLQ